MNEYLVPANTKKSMLILGLFRAKDIWVIIIGFGLFLFVAFTLSLNTFGEVITAIIPLLVTATLVSPMPNYHNVMQFLVNMYTFLTGRRRYLWKGWTYKSDENDK